MILDLPLKSSATIMSGGLAGTSGTGMRYLLTVGGTWVAADKWTIVFTNSSVTGQTQVGAGHITGIVPVFCFTFNDKVYVLAGAFVYMSAVGEPTVFNNPDGVGNGFVQLTNHYGTPEDLVSIASFQGRLIFFSRQTAQIWTVPASIADWELNQIFDFLGSRSPLSTKTLGDLEAFFLDEVGIRSFRARESTFNGVPEDLGSPIDEIIQAALIASSEGQKNGACGIVEPASKRYWLFLKDTIYVFSNFPSSKVAAWGKYSPTFNLSGTQTAFVPEKFVVWKGQVYSRAGDFLFTYGGSDNNTYDACVASWETPWLDAKTPGHRKESKSVDIALIGAWQLKAGMDPVSGTLVEVYNNASTVLSSYDLGTVPYSDRGTHFKMFGQTTGSTAAKVGMLLFKYEQGDEV